MARNVSALSVAIGCGLAVGALWGCSSSEPTAVNESTLTELEGPNVPRVSRAAARALSVAADVDSLAYALAVALRDSTLRRQLHTDLRNSPFAYQGLHAQAYLTGASGSRLLSAMAPAMKRPPRDWA